MTTQHAGEGLTKREAFAMAAMQGILANPNFDFAPLKPDSIAKATESAYAIADAMLAHAGESL